MTKDKKIDLEQLQKNLQLLPFNNHNMLLQKKIYEDLTTLTINMLNGKYKKIKMSETDRSDVIVATVAEIMTRFNNKDYKHNFILTAIYHALKNHIPSYQFNKKLKGKHPYYQERIRIISNTTNIDDLLEKEYCDDEWIEE